MSAASHGRRPVVLLNPSIDDQAACLEVFGHRRAGVRRWMLDVWPVDILPRKLEVCGNRFATIVRVANARAADDQHAMLVKDVDRRDRGVGPLSLFLTAILRLGFEKREILIE